MTATAGTLRSGPTSTVKPTNGYRSRQTPAKINNCSEHRLVNLSYVSDLHATFDRINGARRAALNRTNKFLHRTKYPRLYIDLPYVQRIEINAEIIVE